MAKVKKEKSPTTQGSENKTGKTNGVLFGVLAFLVATLIMVAVVGGAFYYLISNNTNGMADKYRNEISKIPVLSWALPKQKEAKDPYDPKSFTDEQLRSKYEELRKLRTDLIKQLETANKNIDELQKVKDLMDKLKADDDKFKKDMETQKAQIEAEKKQLEEDKKKLSEIIANGDKAGFKAYFEKVDKDTAANIYASIITEQKVSEGAIKNAKLYENMDPLSAAQIFQQLGNSKIDMIVEILQNMSKEISAQVLTAMDTTFASKVAEKLHKSYTTP